MAIGSSLGITLPTQGGNTGTWGTDLNTELQKVIDAVEAQVPASAIDFSADFDLNGFGITSVEGVAFDQQSSYSGLNSIYFDTAGELYVRDGSNQTIQMTSGGSVNTASNGGVGDTGGDYGTNGIVFDWDGTIYNAKNGSSPYAYANVRMDELQLRDGSGNDLTIAVPAMSTNYTLTLPSAVPAANATILQATTAGTVSFSNSFAQNITLTGSAEVKHGSRTRVISALTGIGYDSTFASVVNHDPSGVNNTFWEADAAGDVFFLPINLDVGERITSIRCLLYGGNTSAKSVYLHAVNGTAGTGVESETAATAASSGNVEVTMTVSPQLTMAADTSYHFKFEAEAANDRVYAIEVTYDRP